MTQFRMHTIRGRLCAQCEGPVSKRRAALGYKVCLPCGEETARTERKAWTVAPMHKSNYVLVTDPSDLQLINNKR
jgi:hypothetical protein